MKQLLPPVPYSTPMTGPGGMISVPWTGFFKQLSKGWLNVRGSGTNDLAASGYVGEFVSANSAGPAVAASASYANLASISLTAGDWDVEGIGYVALGPFTPSAVSSAVSLNPGSIDTSGSGGIASLPATAVQVSVPTGTRRISLSATASVYLLGSVTYSAGSGSWSANSFIRARRVR